LIPRSEVETFGLAIWSGRQSPDHKHSHRHNEIELNYVESGAITYMHAGLEIRIGSHESAMFWGAVPHQLVHYEAATVIDIATVPLEDVLQWDLPQAFLSALLSGSLMRFGQDHLLAYDGAMYRQWQNDLNAGSSHIALMEIKAFLQRCARLDVSPDTDVRPSDHVPHKAQQMAQYISRHFQQSISVSDVAAAVSLHPHYAMAVFKSGFDMTMIDYLNQQRIAYVQQHLLTTDANVIDIAYDAGFQTISHFYSAFKQLCGVPPGKYRAALRGIAHL
jgi:AraC-like DNA-binding protein